MNVPSKDDIRAVQIASIEDVERQLASGTALILVGGKLISREAAWACTQALRTCFDAEVYYDGQQREEDGSWMARGTAGLPGPLVLIPLGRFPG